MSKGLGNWNCSERREVEDDTDMGGGVFSVVVAEEEK